MGSFFGAFVEIKGVNWVRLAFFLFARSLFRRSQLREPGTSPGFQADSMVARDAKRIVFRPGGKALVADERPTDLRLRRVLRNSGADLSPDWHIPVGRPHRPHGVDFSGGGAFFVFSSVRQV
jgi:hypothetical protein